MFKKIDGSPGFYETEFQMLVSPSDILLTDGNETGAGTLSKAEWQNMAGWLVHFAQIHKEWVAVSWKAFIGPIAAQCVALSEANTAARHGGGNVDKQVLKKCGTVVMLMTASTGDVSGYIPSILNKMEEAGLLRQTFQEGDDVKETGGCILELTPKAVEIIQRNQQRWDIVPA